MKGTEIETSESVIPVENISRKLTYRRLKCTLR